MARPPSVSPRRSPKKPGGLSRKVERVARAVTPSVETSIAATAAATGALLSAGASPVGAALAAGGSTAAAALVKDAYDFFLAYVRYRWQVWFDAYTEGRGDAALVEVQLFVEAEDPIVQELVVESARALAEALTPSVVPVMARLTREYVSAKCAADAFFRGMRRLLSDVTEWEFHSLRALIVGIAQLEIDPKAGTLDFIRLKVGDEWVLRAQFESQTNTNETVDIKDMPHATRLLQLLKMHGIGDDGLGRYGLPAKDTLLIDLGTARRICNLLRP